MTAYLGLPLWLWVVFALALLGAAGYFIREKVRQVRARRAIDNVISSVAFDELRNVLLPTGTGDQIHLNYLLLTQNGLLVIDLFDAHGMIFAGEKMEQWSIFGPKRHFMITNPLPMLYDRVAVGAAVCRRRRAGRGTHRVLDARRVPEGAARVGDPPRRAAGPVPGGRARRRGGAAAAFADVWERIKLASQPNPLAD